MLLEGGIVLCFCSCMMITQYFLFFLFYTIFSYSSSITVLKPTASSCPFWSREVTHKARDVSRGWQEYWVIILAFSWVQRVLKNVDIRTHKSPHHQHIRGGRAASILCLLTGQHTEKLLNMPPLLSIDNPHQTNCIKTNLVILFMVWPHHNVSFLINFHFSSTYKRESFNSWLVVFTKLVLN